MTSFREKLMEYLDRIFSFLPINGYSLSFFRVRLVKELLEISRTNHISPEIRRQLFPYVAPFSYYGSYACPFRHTSACRPCKRSTNGYCALKNINLIFEFRLPWDKTRALNLAKQFLNHFEPIEGFSGHFGLAEDVFNSEDGKEFRYRLKLVSCLEDPADVVFLENRGAVQKRDREVQDLVREGI